MMCHNIISLTDISHLHGFKAYFSPYDVDNPTTIYLNCKEFPFLRRFSSKFLRKASFAGPRRPEIPASVQALTAIVFIKSGFSAILIINHIQWVQALIDRYVQGFPETTFLRPVPLPSENDHQR